MTEELQLSPNELAPCAKCGGAANMQFTERRNFLAYCPTGCDAIVAVSRPLAAEYWARRQAEFLHAPVWYREYRGAWAPEELHAPVVEKAEPRKCDKCGEPEWVGRKFLSKYVDRCGDCQASGWGSTPLADQPVKQTEPPHAGQHAKLGVKP